MEKRLSFTVVFAVLWGLMLNIDDDKELMQGTSPGQPRPSLTPVKSPCQFPHVLEATVYSEDHLIERPANKGHYLGTLEARDWILAPVCAF